MEPPKEITVTIKNSFPFFLLPAGADGAITRYFSRKGRKGAKNAKGEERVFVREHSL
jgi:hypothetical protein